MFLHDSFRQVFVSNSSETSPCQESNNSTDCHTQQKWKDCWENNSVSRKSFLTFLTKCLIIINSDCSVIEIKRLTSSRDSYHFFIYSKIFHNVEALVYFPLWDVNTEIFLTNYNAYISTVTARILASRAGPTEGFINNLWADRRRFPGATIFSTPAENFRI